MLETYGDMLNIIQDMSLSFRKYIDAEIVKMKDHLRAMNAFFSLIDVYTSLVISNEEYSLVRPEFKSSQEGKRGLQIEGAGNTMVGFEKTFTFLDYNVDPNHGATIVNGSSGSGKSIYLKTIGVIIYLA